MTRPLGIAAALFALASFPSLGDGGRASGTVKDADGSPVSGISLRLVGDDGTPATAQPIAVEKGRFVIPAFPAGSWHLRVEGDAFAIRRFEITVRGDGGARLGATGADVPPGATAPAFAVSGSQRAEIVLILGAAGGPSAAEIHAAKASSESLRRLNALFEKGDFAALLAACDEALGKDPSVAGAHYLRAVALWKTGRATDAAAAIREAVAADRDQPGIFGVAGAILLDAGEPAEAATMFRKALEADPADRANLVNRVIALEKAGQKGEAVEAIEALVAADPTNTKARLRAAELLTDLGRSEDALTWLDGIPSPDATVALAMYNASVPLYNAGKMAAVVAAMRHAIAFAPESAPAHRLLGRALLADGDVPGAVKELGEFLRLAPDDPEAPAERDLLKAIK